MFGLLFSWFIGQQSKKISCTKTKTLPNLRLSISSGDCKRNEVDLVLDTYRRYIPAFLAELVKTHIEEVKRLWPNIRRAKGEFVVKCLGVSFDSFRQEVWVRVWDLKKWVDLNWIFWFRNFINSDFLLLMEKSSWMDSVTEAPTCMRSTDIRSFSLYGQFFTGPDWNKLYQLIIYNQLTRSACYYGQFSLAITRLGNRLVRVSDFSL